METINLIGQWIVILFIVLGTLAFIGTIVYAKVLRRKRTRENFAFVALTTISLLMGNAISIIAFDNILFEVIRSLLNNIPNVSIEEIHLDTSDKWMIVLLISMCIFLVLYPYANWNTRSELKLKDILFLNQPYL